MSFTLIFFPLVSVFLFFFFNFFKGMFQNPTSGALWSPTDVVISSSSSASLHEKRNSQGHTEPGPVAALTTAIPTATAMTSYVVRTRLSLNVVCQFQGHWAWRIKCPSGFLCLWISFRIVHPKFTFYHCFYRSKPALLSSLKKIY